MKLPNQLAREIPTLRSFIDRAVKCDGMSVQEKAQYLEHLLWLFRISVKDFDQTIKYDSVLKSDLHVSHDSIALAHRSLSGELCGKSEPLRSIEIQPMLLQFLLLQGNQRIDVLDTIHQFIERIYDRLTPEDMERTETGAIRCFTNTRFAANTLREYGFLRFSESEAYKCWRLTFPGLLTAGYFYLHPPRSSPPCGAWKGLHPEFDKVITHYSDPGNCVKTLAGLAGKSGDVFSSYMPLFTKFSHRLASWRKDMQQAGSRNDAKQSSKLWVVDLEKDVDLLKFAEDYSADVQITKIEMSW